MPDMYRNQHGPDSQRFVGDVEASPPRSPSRLLAVLSVFLLWVACGGPVDKSDAPVEKDPTDTRAALPPEGAESFVDVSLGAGVDFLHRLPTEDLENIVDSLGGGGAFADLDDDGWLDLVVLGGPRSPDGESSPDQHAGVRLYRNRRDGTFEDITSDSGIPAQSSALSVAVGDADGDGRRDLYLVDRGPNRLYRNLGRGRFEDVTRSAGVGNEQFGTAAVFFDKDGDDDLDLFVGNYLDYDARQTAFFSPNAFPGPLNYEAEADVLYENQGDGTFVDVSESSGIAQLRGRAMSVAAADFDGDGDTDLFVANDATENFLLLNDGAGQFSEAAISAGVAMGENGEQTGAMAADVGDVDGDGQLDLVVSDTAFGAYYRQIAPGVFADEVMVAGLGVLCGQYVSWGQALLDYDNDGDLDLFVVNGDLHHLVGWEDLLLRNTGRGRYEDASHEGGSYFAEQRSGRASIVGDYDNDGDQDVLVTSVDGRAQLLRNDAGSTSSWLTLDLVGRKMREPFGARVVASAGERSWVAEYRPRSNYLGQGDSRLHLGLGDDVEKLDEIRIQWPDGEVQILSDVAARQVKVVEQSP